MAYEWDDDYDDEYNAERECEHEHYDIDVCTGRASCDYCSHHWYLSSEEIDAELDRQARYYDDMEREERRQRWRDRFHFILYPLAVLHWEWQKLKLRWRRSPVLDDDIPF